MQGGQLVVFQFQQSLQGRQLAFQVTQAGVQFGVFALDLIEIFLIGGKLVAQLLNFTVAALVGRLTGRCDGQSRFGAGFGCIVNSGVFARRRIQLGRRIQVAVRRERFTSPNGVLTANFLYR